MTKTNPSRFRRHPWPWRATAGAALVALAAWATPHAHAQVTLLDVSNGTDGTEGFDAGQSGPGYDAGPTNKIVRTNDEFTYQMTFRTGALGDTNVKLTSKLPAGGHSEWTGVPGPCDGAGSEVSADGQTLTCVVTNVTPNTTQTIIFTGLVRGTTPNNTALTPPVTALTSGSVATALSPNSNAENLTVTAAPFYDVVVQMSYQGNPRSYGWRTENGPAGEDGAYHRPMVGLVARHPNGHGRKGVEQLNSDPVEIKVDLAYPAGVRLDTWHDGTAPHGTPAATGGFATGCGSPWAGNPSYESGSSINTFDRVRDTGGASTAASVVPNGGTCGIVSATEQQITLSLTGVDTSLKRRPTLKGGDFTVPDTEWWVSNKALVLWTPLSSYPANGTALTHTIKFNSIKAKSISGQAVPVPANPPQGGQKEASYAMQNTTTGSASKYYTPEAVEAAPRPAPFATAEDPGVNSDRHVNHMAKAQVVSGRVVYNNLGATDHFDVYLCEIIDRTAFDLDPAVFGVRSYGQVNTVKYGSRNAGKFFPSTGTATGEYADSSIGTSAYGTAKCNDPGITWHGSKDEAEQAGGLVYVRADIPRMRAGESHYLYVRGLVLRETWAETIDVEGGSQRVKDDPIPAGAVIRNRGDVSSGSANLAWIDDAMLRDHLVVVPSRTISRVKKTVASPANTDTTPVSAGSTVRYRLEPRFATTFPPLKANFTVTDVLPPGLTYQPGSATVAPTVAANTPEAGYTTLTWDLGEKTPYLGADSDAGAQLGAIEFNAVVDLGVANDSSLRNHVAVHGGINDYEAACTFSTANGFGDCAKASVADIRVRTAPGFRIEKRTTTPTITAGEDFQYELKYTALVDVSAPDIPHWIDILPYVGDSALSRSPGSTFDAGAYALKGVVKPTDDAAAQIYYTNRTPAQVENDPRHASNGSGGATKWCLETAFGSAGCPANMAAVTAVRIQPGVSTLAGGKGYAVLLNFSTDANIAKGGDIFNNSVGGHSPDPTSSLQYVYAQSQQPVRIAGNSLAGHVYEDMNDNGQLEGGEAGIANNTITLYGCVAGANGTVDTTAMNMTTSPPSCTGDDQLVTRTATSGATDGAFAFQGLADGLYSLVQPTQPAGYNDGKTTAGNGGGTASAQGTLPSSIVNIPLTNNGAGKNYNFGELKPVGPTIQAINDDYGNKPNNVVQTLPSVLVGPGSTPDKANGANAATGPTGNVDLTPGALSHAPATGSISMNADGVITIAAGTTPGSYTYGYTICLKAPHQATCSTATAKVTVTGGAQPTPAIAAVNDDYGTVVNDQVHTLVTVLQGPGTTPDTANGVPATPANVTLTPGTLSATPADGGITMDANGVITVKSTTTPGTYTYGYKICLKAPNAGTCASAEAKVKVIAGPPAPPGRSNVSLVKTVDNPGAAIGTEVTFTVKVQNRGPEDAANVQVQEQLPAGFALVSANPSVGAYSAPTWTIGALANGASATLTIKAKVNATGPYANTATVSTTTPDYSAGDDSDTATVTPSAPAAIDAIDDDYGVRENNRLHTLPSVLTGPGSTPDMVGGVTAAPADVTLTPGAPSIAPTAGYIAMDSDGVIIIAAGTTPGEYSFTYKICLKAPNDAVCDTAVAKVRVIAASGTEPSIDAIDDDYGTKPNNVAHTLPSVLVGPVSTPDKADAGVNATLANVTLTPGAPSVMPANGAIAMNGSGEITIAAGTTPDDYQFVYTICLKAPHDTVCDIAIAKVKVQAATGPAPTVDAIDDNYGIKINNVAHTLPSVLVGPNGTTPDQANGVNASLVNVTLTPGTLSTLPATGSIVMDTSGTLTIAAGTTPGTYTYPYTICLVAASTVCDSATATVIVAGVADMGVVKTVEPGVVAAGDKVTFTITVKNHGPSDALDVQVIEALPSGYTLVSATPSVGTFAAPVWKVGTLVNGASATLKVVATVNATGDYLNVVTVSTASSDSVHANNQASVMPASLQQPTPPASAVPVPANAPWAVLLVMLAMWMLAYRARFGRK
ncbi:MAG: hypothetical protein Q4A98_05625 [Comamonadaceae bacterium]|nr:hypothetical protein [Comamonadaceae bacterium]